MKKTTTFSIAILTIVLVFVGISSFVLADLRNDEIKNDTQTKTEIKFAKKYFKMRL